MMNQLGDFQPGDLVKCIFRNYGYNLDDGEDSAFKEPEYAIIVEKFRSIEYNGQMVMVPMSWKVLIHNEIRVVSDSCIEKDDD